ncbi:MAG: NlpC/P60 family protein [Bacillota bacterium]
MKKALILLIAALVAIAVVPLLAEAATERYVEVTGAWVRFYVNPSIKSATASRLEQGERVRLVRQYNDHWYEVSHNGQLLYLTTNSRYTQLVTVNAPASESYVVCDAAWVRFRTAPSIDAPTAGQIERGQRARLIQQYNNYWYEVLWNGQRLYLTTNAKYTHVETVSEPVGSPSPAPPQPEYEYYVETDHGWVSYRTGPSTSAAVAGRLQLGDRAPLIRQYNKYWYEILWDGESYYITANPTYTRLVPANQADPYSGWTWEQKANRLIEVARSQLGVKYIWGHQEPGVGFDCSNFTAWVFGEALGIRFSSASSYQRFNVGDPIALSEIRRGDLLFFATNDKADGSGHVGIYMGDGKVIHQSSTPGYVSIQPLDGTWLGRNLVFARRVIR